MNTILQKLIEEEARDIAELCPDCNFLCKGPHPCIPKIIYEKLIEIADFALQNQWISVEEALPEKEGRYLCNYHYTMPNSDEECNCVDFGLFKDGKWYVANNEVTHWMPIPSLEGDEK